jgi:hypothetical protein
VTWQLAAQQLPRQGLEQLGDVIAKDITDLQAAIPLQKKHVKRLGSLLQRERQRRRNVDGL